MTSGTEKSGDFTEKRERTQATDHVKAITTPKVHQWDTAIQTEVITKTWPQEEIPPQNTSSANDRKSGNNPPLKLNKEKVKKKTLIVWRLNN